MFFGCFRFYIYALYTILRFSADGVLVEPAIFTVFREAVISTTKVYYNVTCSEFRSCRFNVPLAV